MPAFQALLDSAKVIGTVLIFDLEEEKYYSNDFVWADRGNLPASTFKIANSLIALETGVVEDEQTLFQWDGEERWLKVWEQDLVFKQAFHYSCVPCYQEVARKIGAVQMNEYLDKFNYGKMQVDTSNIDQFWLEGGSRISPFEQIDFLQRFYLSGLPITERTESIMKTMMVMEEKEGRKRRKKKKEEKEGRKRRKKKKEEKEGRKLSGKTGWSTTEGKANGWFVGYLETPDKTYIFATNLEPGSQFDMAHFAEIRKVLTVRALELLGKRERVKG